MITDPKDLNGLPSGTYEVGGKAAEEVRRQYAAQVREKVLRLPRQPVLHAPTCKCACGCERKSRAGLLFCSLCRRGAHRLDASGQAYVERRNGITEDRARTHCTRCGVPKGWSELQPGTGLCNNCSS